MVEITFRDAAALRDGKVPVTVALSPMENLGVPKSDKEALKQRRSVQPYARLDRDGEETTPLVTDTEAPKDIVGLLFIDGDTLGSGKEPVIEAVAPIDIVEIP